MLLESDATKSSASIWLFHDMFPIRCSLFYSFLFCTVLAINTCKHGLILSLRSCITSHKSPVKRVKGMLPIGKPGHDIVYIEYDIKIKRIEQAPRKIYLYKRADMDGLCDHMARFRDSLLSADYEHMSANALWVSFKSRVHCGYGKIYTI